MIKKDKRIIIRVTSSLFDRLKDLNVNISVYTRNALLSRLNETSKVNRLKKKNKAS